MQAVVKSISAKVGQRVIAISDIHGNLEVFRRLLEKIRFGQGDILILVGDMLEKGPECLPTLRFIMELEKEFQVYSILGNCDMVLLTLMRPDENERLHQYLLERKSTIHEMYEELGERIDSSTNMVTLKHRLCQAYEKELDWLSSLPHIIQVGQYIFAHAAIKSENFSENTMQDVINEEAFYWQEHQFNRTVVVGHMPVVLFNDKVSKCNPIFNHEKNILCIDGGNVIKKDGQLNAVIFEDVEQKEMEFVCMDLLPKAIVCTTVNVPKNQDSINVRWSDGEVEILKEQDEFAYCRHKSSNRKLWILKEFISNYQGETWADEGTDYILPVQAGDVVSIVQETSHGYLLKKDGVTGWYDGRLQLL